MCVCVCVHMCVCVCVHVCVCVCVQVLIVSAINSVDGVSDYSKADAIVEVRHCSIAALQHAALQHAAL